MKHGKYAKGFRSMSRIRSHPIIAARDFYYSHVIYEEELALSAGSNYFSRLWGLLPQFLDPSSQTTVPQGLSCWLSRCAVSTVSLRTAESMLGSHLVLFVDHLHRRRLRAYSGYLRLFGLRRGSGRLHVSDAVHDRHSRSPRLCLIVSSRNVCGADW